MLFCVSVTPNAWFSVRRDSNITLGYKVDITWAMHLHILQPRVSDSLRDDSAMHQATAAKLVQPIR